MGRITASCSLTGRTRKVCKEFELKSKQWEGAIWRGGKLPGQSGPQRKGLYAELNYMLIGRSKLSLQDHSDESKGYSQ